MMKGLWTWVASLFGHKTSEVHRMELFVKYDQLCNEEGEEVIMAVLDDGNYGINKAPRVGERIWFLRDGQGTIHQVGWSKIRDFVGSEIYA